MINAAMLLLLLLIKGIEMRKIIDGLVYNVATSDLICEYDNGLSVDDFNHELISLYRTRNGRFFVVGRGGPATNWRVPGDNSNSWRGGEALSVKDYEDARAFCEMHGDY